MITLANAPTAGHGGAPCLWLMSRGRVGASEETLGPVPVCGRTVPVCGRTVPVCGRTVPVCRLLVGVGSLGAKLAQPGPHDIGGTHMTTLKDFDARTIGGEEQSLEQYLGQVVLVVNTASMCGFTPQFGGLEKLYSELRDQGLVVLGFPCDQFANQEYAEEVEIEDFCRTNYGVTFPMFAKVDVNGKDAHPLFGWLRSETGGVLGDSIKWNFTKFLVNREGTVVRRYPPTVPPEAIEDDIRALL